MYNVGVANNDGVVFIVDEDDVSNGNGEKRRKRILYDATNVVLTTRTAAQVKVQRSTVESVVAVINAVFGNLCCCFGWLLRLQWSLGWSDLRGWQRFLKTVLRCKSLECFRYQTLWLQIYRGVGREKMFHVFRCVLYSTVCDNLHGGINYLTRAGRIPPK